MDRKQRNSISRVSISNIQLFYFKRWFFKMSKQCNTGSAMSPDECIGRCALQKLWQHSWNFLVISRKCHFRPMQSFDGPLNLLTYHLRWHHNKGYLLKWAWHIIVFVSNRTRRHHVDASFEFRISNAVFRWSRNSTTLREPSDLTAIGPMRYWRQRAKSGGSDAFFRWTGSDQLSLTYLFGHVTSPEVAKFACIN